MPEGLQQTERGNKMQTAIETMEEAYQPLVTYSKPSTKQPNRMIEWIDKRPAKSEDRSQSGRSTSVPRRIGK